MFHFPSVRTDVLHHRLDDQTLVYDPKKDCVHLLDPTTSYLFDLLGRPDRGNVDLDPSLYSLALDELRKAELIEEEAQSPTLADITRRQMLRRVAAAGIAAAAVPAITTLTAETLNAQAGTCLPTDALCTNDNQCCSNKCKNGSNGGFCQS